VYAEFFLQVFLTPVINSLTNSFPTHLNQYWNIVNQ
jgi:hypothetical protein